ncbi:MAG: DUF3592 domain-containing protein [Aridibacter sp.]
MKERRDFLINSGRICDGVILDSETDENKDEIVRYHYNIHGVDFESAEILSEEQMKNSIKYAPGANVGVRFDPKNHGNSILV